MQIPSGSCLGVFMRYPRAPYVLDESIRPHCNLISSIYWSYLHLLTGIHRRSRIILEIAMNFWPIGVVSCLFYLCLNRWRLKWADRSYYGVSCRIPRESWEKGWFIRKVHYPLFPTVLSRLSVIDDCVCLNRLWVIFTKGKFTFPRLRRPECPAGPVLV